MSKVTEQVNSDSDDGIFYSINSDFIVIPLKKRVKTVNGIYLLKKLMMNMI